MTPARPSLRRRAATLVAAVALVLPVAGAQGQAQAADAVLGGPLLGLPGVVTSPVSGVPGPPRVGAAGWLIADLDTGEVLAAKHAHGRFAPASTLKTLTALALIPELERGAQHVATAAEVGVDGSKVGLVPGHPYRVDTLLRSLLVVSANDAANALAGAAGGQARTVALMNQTAARLQANDTVARNPSGLDASGQRSSPYDLALITRAAMALPSYRTYVSTLRSRVEAPGGRSFEIYNHNKLMTRYPGITGGKTGYTVAARHSYVVTATRGGRSLVVTLMRAETTYPQARALLDWGFTVAGRVPAIGRLVDPLPADGARIDDGRADRSSRDAGLADVANTSTQLASAGVTGAQGSGGSPAVATVSAALVVLAVQARRVQVRRRVRRRRVTRNLLGPSHS